MRVPLVRCAVALLLTAGPVLAQSDPRAELAAMRQDVLELRQRVGELAMTVEQLSHDNSALQAKAAQSYVTLEQLNRAIAELNRSVQSEMGEQKRDILGQVASQLEKMGKQTNAALDALAKSQATRPVVQTTFTDDFPKEGVNYTVQAGDTLAVIARKHNAKLQDIINANKISDASKVRAGQTLFIPQGK